jgi:outer membrane protein OmpA-like peptidoglycan-associated protein
MNRLSLLLTFFILMAGLSARAQRSPLYYTTIGVFMKKSNADALMTKSIGQGYATKQGQKVNGNLYYVYVLYTADKQKAFALAIKLRVESEYKGAWVFQGYLTGSEPEAPAIVEPEVKPEPPKVEPIIVAPVEIKPTIDSTALKIVEPVVEKVEPTPIVKKPAGKAFYFKLVSEADGNEIKAGEIHLQEATTASQYQSYKPGELIYLNAPRNKKGTYTLKTQVPGYGEATITFDYADTPAAKGSEGESIIEIPIPKAKRGDYIDFTNVKFFKNSSILQPTSQNELDGVVALLKENLKYEIKIHGHVNGTQPRESFIRGEKSSFFATNIAFDKTVKKMESKDLSLSRAETVRDYLVSMGIASNRISVKGEGGKIPLYPEGGTLGQLNDRVEIEFVKN